MQTRFQMPVNGMEVQQSDLNLLGQVSSAADDAVIAEFMRLLPFSSGSPAKATFPYGNVGLLKGASIVAVTGSANGAVTINPFRALIGSRAVAASGALANWSDARSTIYVGSATSLTSTLALAPNSSGNPRWDLVYGAVAIDANGSSVTRFVKDPTTKVVNAQSVVNTLVTSITIGVAQGTPAGSPVRPSLPSDTSSVYYIPLAFIRVVNGFNGTTLVVVDDIQDAAPTAVMSRTTGASNLAPANQSHGATRTVLTNTPWSMTAGALRPQIYIPPTMVGSDSIYFFVEQSGGFISHNPGDIIDDSRDWRGRYFSITAQAGPGAVTASGAYGTPDIAQGMPGGHIASSVVSGIQAPLATVMTLSNSWDGPLQFTLPLGGTNSKTYIFLADHGNFPSMASGAVIGIYVDPTTGALKWDSIGTTTNPVACFFFWITATAQKSF